MLELSSEKPGIVEPEEEPPPPPPEPEPEPAVKAEPEPIEDEDDWDEDYEEHIDGEEPPPQRPRKKRRYGGIIVLAIIIFILVFWTVMSPKIMPEVGTTYTTSPRYANLGNYTGYRDIWAGNMTWGVAISGQNSTTVGTTINISVLVTKIYEKPGNWFFRGTSISLKNVSFFDENGTCVGAMANWSDEGIGMIATVPVKFYQTGSYYLYAFIRFMVFMDMRIGYLPLETVQIAEAYLNVPIVVS